MQTVVGIDEAGYSPLLGPLVVSAAGFEAEAVPADWWAELKLPRAAGGAARSALPPVDDSKKIYTPSKGAAGLELAVLAFLKAIGRAPTTLRLLLDCLDAQVDTDAYPWYRGADVSLPFAAEPEAIDRAAGELSRTFENSGIRFTGFRSEPMAVGDYNARLHLHDKKSLVLFQSTLELVSVFLRPGKAARFLVDKQGARNFYGELISQYFFGCRVQRKVESKKISEYSVRHNTAEFDISFCMKGDAFHLPIALASMCSKYVRELFMEMFNRYWRSVRPGIRPTSGYQLDGRRFIEGISASPEYAEIPRSLLVREK